MLIEPRKVRALEWAYARYGRRLLRQAFARVRVGGDGPWAAAAPDAPDAPDAGRGPVIAFANHSAWWDPVLALVLSHDLFRRDQFGVMRGTQLARFPFFRTIGCFGVTSGSLEDTRALARCAADLLRDRARPRLLWIFPQGALLPARHPIAFGSGLARLAREVPGATLLPVAVRYEFLEEQRPECVVRLGEPLAPAERSAAESPRALTRRLEERLRRELATLDADIASAAGGALPATYRVLLGGRGSLSALYERTIGRLGRADRAERAESREQN